MSDKELLSKALETLGAAGNVLDGGAAATVGFDGFVDTILHVVDKRQSVTEWERLSKMTEFAERIEQGAGLSLNMEYVVHMVKLGGNGPIMANALNSFGLPITYIGALGHPTIHPVFEEFAEQAKVYSISEPGYTDAAEFDDGKVMFGKHENLRHVNWENLTRHLSVPQLQEIFSQSRVIALVNWTMLPAMSDVFEKLLSEIAPKLEGEKRWLFFDLADPAKRQSEDLLEATRLISRFEEYFNVIFGMNLQESRQVGSVLGLDFPGEELDLVEEHARRLREKMAISTVVIHPTAFAAAADANASAAVKGPYVEKPLITTGAGDHFNAGFCLGRLLGGDIPSSLQIAVGTSGYYVRKAKSPSVEELRGFLESLRAG